MRIVDNALARALAAPAYVPELLVQRNTLVLYISTGLNPGDWISVSDAAPGATSFATLTGDPYDNANLTTALNAKQNSLGFTAENVSNKDVDATFAANSDVKYPSQKAVKTAFATKVTGALTTDGTFSAASDLIVPSALAVKTYADQLIASQDAMVFKGLIDCSANPNYPAADRGNTYRVSVAGKIGGASGPAVEVGDMLICLTDGTASGNHATAGASWGIIETNIDGEVIGPVSSVDGNVVLFNGTSGKLIKDAGFAPQPLDGDLTSLAAATDTNAIYYRVVANSWTKVKYGAGLQFVAGVLGQVVNQAQLIPEASKSSAATLVLTGETETNYDVTGTTNISAITLEEGRTVLLRFTGAGLTLTPGASFLLPGNAPIITTANGWGLFLGGAAGVVTCTDYQNAAGYSTQTFDNVYLNSDANVGFAPNSGVNFTVGKQETGLSTVAWYFRFNKGGGASIVHNENFGTQISLRMHDDTDSGSIFWPRTGSGELATTNGVETFTGKTINASQLVDASVTFAKLANVATASFVGRNTAGTGVPEVLSIATARSMLSDKLILSLSNSPTVVSTLDGIQYMSPTSAGGSAEGDVSFVIPCAGTIKNLNVRTGVSGATATPVTVLTIRKNKADTALTVTMNQTNETTTTDSTHSVSFAAGDRLTLSALTTGTAATSNTITSISVEFDAT